MSDPALMESPTIESPTTAPEPVATPPATLPADPLADLILVRLLPATKSVGLKDLTKDVGGLFQMPPSAERVGEALKALRDAGLVTPKGQMLTDAGRVPALAYLGITELPPKANWGIVKAKYLLPKALGLSPTSADDGKGLGDSKKLAALLLKRKFALPVGTPNTLNGAFEAIACQLLGFPDQTSLKAVIPTVISREKKYDPPLTTEDLEKVGPRLLLDAQKPGVEGLRAVALRGLVGAEPKQPVATPEPVAPPEPVVDSEPFDLETFAATVKSEARTCPTGRFGDNKVFISHVWRQLKDEAQFAPLGLTGFKEKLIEANRENLLTLSRADLVQLMDPTDVQESETAYLNAVFHFVLVEKE